MGQKLPRAGEACRPCCPLCTHERPNFLQRNECNDVPEADVDGPDKQAQPRRTSSPRGAKRNAGAAHADSPAPSFASLYLGYTLAPYVPWA